MFLDIDSFDPPSSPGSQHTFVQRRGPRLCELELCRSDAHNKFTRILKLLAIVAANLLATYLIPGCVEKGVHWDLRICPSASAASENLETPPKKKKII